MSLSTVLLVMYGNGAVPQIAMAQEENYHVVECVLPHYFLCDNGNCLPESHICDSHNDWYGAGFCNGIVINLVYFYLAATTAMKILLFAVSDHCFSIQT